MNLGLVLFGIVALAVGLGTGYLIYANPDGLNPAWPMWMAMVVPAVFGLGGLHMIAGGLGYPRFSSAMLRAIAVCFLAIANWAAFFTTTIQCIETVSFLGVAILARYPSEMECRNGLRVIVACVDVLVVLPAIFLAWRKWQNLRGAPTK